MKDKTKEKNTEEEKTEETKTEEDVTEEKSAPQEAEAEPEQGEPEAEDTKTDAAEDKDALKNDKGYRRGKLIYDTGIILMAAMLLLNAARFFLQTELYIGGEFRTALLYFLYLIPCALMIVGLALTGKASRRYNVKGGDSVGIGVIICIAVLISALGVVETVKPSYHVYTTKDVTLRDGEELFAVEYIQLGFFDNASQKRPGQYCVDVYKTEGIFAKKLVTGNVFYARYNILAGEGKNDYLLDIQSAVGGETIPFTYK